MIQQKLSAYSRLARFDKPAGILLLWAPTAWALWFANHGHPSIKLVLIFLLGTILMRAAGCIINDIADRDIDCHVERTKHRPLTCGEVSLVECLMVLSCLLFGALILLINLPLNCFRYAFIALLVTVIYPFCKRFISAPQLVLGVAFSMGIPMAYVASGVTFDGVFWVLCLLNFLWIIAYDTVYAMVDKPDDQVIGVRSTAIWFGRYDRLVSTYLLAIMHLLWLILAFCLALSWFFYFGWLMATFLLTWEVYLIRSDDREKIFQGFIMNAWYGLIMWLAISH